MITNPLGTTRCLPFGRWTTLRILHPRAADGTHRANHNAAKESYLSRAYYFRRSFVTIVTHWKGFGKVTILLPAPYFGAHLHASTSPATRGPLGKAVLRFSYLRPPPYPRGNHWTHERWTRGRWTRELWTWKLERGPGLGNTGPWIQAHWPLDLRTLEQWTWELCSTVSL